MRLPKSLETLAEQGIIEEVLRPLMSGKEAQIYLVVAQGDVCAAKVYKEAQNRSFKHRADYTEGRKTRNTRDQRAIAKGSKYGKSKDEDAWRSTEVDMIYKLRDAGVRVPTPYTFIDGVLVMELVQDPDGNPAPRLGDLDFTAEEATEIFHLLLREVTRMLCAGVVHGDLSDFNVLLAWDGPVLIDFPQSVDPGSNLNARTLLLRDIENLHRFLARFVPGVRRRPYGEEMWSLYESNRLTSETILTGQFKRSSGPVDTSAVLELIGEANRDETSRRLASGQKPVQSAVPMRRREVVIEKPAARVPAQRRGGPEHSGDRPRQGSSPRAEGGQRPFDHHNGQRSGGHSAQRDNAQRDNRGGGYDSGRRAGPPRDQRDTRRDDQCRGPVRPQAGGPKRGDNVQNSAYVSPEARKARPLVLTPRNESAPTESRRESRGEGDRSRRARAPRDLENRARRPRDSQERDTRSPRAPRGPRSYVRGTTSTSTSSRDERYSSREQRPSGRSDQEASRTRGPRPTPDSGSLGSNTRDNNSEPRPRRRRRSFAAD